MLVFFLMVAIVATSVWMELGKIPPPSTQAGAV